MTPQELEAIKHSGDLYALGVKPSPIDLNDYVFTAPQPGTLPAWNHPSARDVPVRDQQANTCVGNSISSVMQYLEHAETGKVIAFNGELVNARVVGKDSGPGAPAYPKDVLEDVRLHGIVSFPNDKGFDLYFPAGYGLVDHTNPEAVSSAMTTPGVMLTFTVWLLSNFDTQDDGKGWFTRYDGRGYIEDLPAENPWALHELTAVGYSPQGVIFQNSWGTGYGWDGFGRLTWNYLAKRGTEMWAVTNAPDNVKEGMVRVYTAPTEPLRGRPVRLAGNPAVWLIVSGGRIWVQSRAMAAQMGIDLTMVKTLAATDPVWNTPVVGPEPK